MSAGGRRPGAPLLESPLLLLDLPAGFTPIELERATRKWLGLLELGAASARTVAGPAGPNERTADAVRAAAAELRDEQRRAEHELWAAIARRAMAAPEDSDGDPPGVGAGTDGSSAATPDAPGWTDALGALGWGRRR